MLVAIGATAASLIVATAKVMRDRGRQLPSPLAEIVIVTVHPSSILRVADSASRELARRQFIKDLRKIARLAR